MNSSSSGTLYTIDDYIKPIKPCETVATRVNAIVIFILMETSIEYKYVSRFHICILSDRNQV